MVLKPVRDCEWLQRGATGEEKEEGALEGVGGVEWRRVAEGSCEIAGGMGGVAAHLSIRTLA